MSLRLPERQRRVLVSSILGLALLAAAPLRAGVNRWTSIGPNGGGVTALAFSANGRTVLAGTKTLGIFRSADNGRTWTPASSGLSGEEVVDLAASPAAPGWVYAVTSSGVFRSDDAGLHWTAADAGLPSMNGRVSAVLVATEPTQPAAVWAALPKEQALYRSTNRGDRWRYAGQGLKGVVHDVAAHPITAGVVFAATDRGLFRSADSGGHWSPSGLRDLEVSRVVFDRVQPRHLYAVILEEGVQRTVIGRVFTSDDGGASWKESSRESSLYGSFELAADPAHAGTAWLSSTQGFFPVLKTRDGGQHWRGVLRRGSSTALAVNPLRPGTVLAGQPQPFMAGEPAVFRTDDGGTSWSASDTGITAQIVDKVLPDPSKPGALYAQVGCCALWKRTGAGQPFTPFFPRILDPDGDRLRFGDLIVDPKTPSTLYLVTYQSFSSFLYKSVDAGATWQQISNLSVDSLSSLNSITIDPAHPSMLYGVATSGDGIYRSDDGGFSWHALSSVVEVETAWLTVTGTAIYTNDLDQSFQFHSWLRRSTDGGATWTTLLELTPDYPFVTALAEDPRDPQRLWVAWLEAGFLPTTGGIYRSTDGGTHWSLSRMAGNRPVFALALDPRNSNRVWAASAGAVFLSEDGGATWVSFSEGLPALDVRDLRLDPLDPDTLYAGTAGGSVYELTRR
jgi:photosystem II stability/assembly factor-like uncharacterized protein